MKRQEIDIAYRRVLANLARHQEETQEGYNCKGENLTEATQELIDAGIVEIVPETRPKYIGKKEMRLTPKGLEMFKKKKRKTRGRSS